MSRWAVVVPSNRPDSLQEFCEAWEDLFLERRVRLYVVMDAEKVWTVHTKVPYRSWAWPDIPKFIPRESDMIRSWGIYRAWRSQSTGYTLSLDDDVRPDVDLFAAYERVFTEGAPLSEYLSVGALTTYGKPMRGFPFEERKPVEVAVQYGGWNGVLDYDAPTQLQGISENESFAPVVVPVPRWTPVTTCIMNAAWQTKYAPLMWQLPLWRGRYNRFGDIWSGLFQKQALDAAGLAMVLNGKATVRHERASNPEKNMEREKPGIPLNEELWVSLHQPLTNDVFEAWKRVTTQASYFFRDKSAAYAKHFEGARDQWLAMFE